MNVDVVGPAPLALVDGDRIIVTPDAPVLVPVALNVACTVALTDRRPLVRFKHVACANDRNLPILSREREFVLEAQSIMALIAGRLPDELLRHPRQLEVKLRGITVTKLIQPEVMVRRNVLELLVRLITLLLNVRQECSVDETLLVLLLWLTIVICVALGRNILLLFATELCTTR